MRSTRRIDPRGVDYTLGMSLKGSTVSVTLNGQVVLGYAYNAATVDGRFGLMAVTGTTKFDDVVVKSTDPAVAAVTATMLAADSPAASDITAPITAGDIQPIVEEAIRRLSPALNESQRAALRSVTFQVTDLPWLQLGDYSEGTIWIDGDAAGYGWFVDPTPWNDREFTDQNGTQLAVSGPAAGRMDLLTVVAHEIGHAAGLEHAEGLMSSTLTAGTRLAPPPATLGSGETRVAAAAVPAAGEAQVAPPPVIINWQGSVFGGSAIGRAEPAADSEGWMADFANHLGKSESERNPNAKIKVLVPPAALKVVSDTARRIGAFFG